MEGAAVSDRDRKRGEGGRRKQGGKSTISPADEAEKPPCGDGHSKRSYDPAARRKPEARNGRKPGRQGGENRRLDEEVIGERRGVELRPQQARSTRNVPRHHGGRDLPADVVFHDRLTDMPDA